MPTKREHKYTNRPELASTDPSWTYVGPADTPVASPGVTLKSRPGYAGDPWSPEEVPETEITMRPEGGFTPEWMAEKFRPAQTVAGGEVTTEEMPAAPGEEIPRHPPGVGPEIAAGKPMSLEKAPGKPMPEDWQAPDFGDREGFEKKVFEIIGGNPFDYNPADEVKNARSFYPTLFNQVFKGKYRYADIAKLPKKALAHWQNQQLQFDKFVDDQANAKKEMMMKKYEWMMNKWDRAKKEYETALEKKSKAMGDKVWVHHPEQKIKKQIPISEWPTAEKEGWVRGTPIGSLEEGGMTAEQKFKIQQAQSLVLRVAKGVDPTIAALIASNPTMANSQIVKEALQKAGIPEDLKPAYEQAIKVLDQFYGVEGAQGQPQPAPAPTIPTETPTPEYDYEYNPESDSMTPRQEKGEAGGGEKEKIWDTYSEAVEAYNKSGGQPQKYREGNSIVTIRPMS